MIQLYNQDKAKQHTKLYIFRLFDNNLSPKNIHASLTNHYKRNLKNNKHKVKYLIKHNRWKIIFQ